MAQNAAIPNCRGCDKPLTVIRGTDSYTIELVDGEWQKSEDASNLVCGNCYEELEHREIEDILRAVGLL